MTCMEFKYQFADDCRRFTRRKGVALPEALKVMKNGGGELRRDEQSSVTQAVKQVTELVTVETGQAPRIFFLREVLCSTRT